MKNFKIGVTGHVQGVWFRASAKEEAERLGLNGFVCNRPDGSVYAEVEGGQGEVTLFVDWCRIGPEKALVRSVQVNDGEMHGYVGFEIRK